MSLLENAIAKGWIWQVDGEYIARAADGELTCMGWVGVDEANIEKYLADYPTPEYW